MPTTYPITLPVGSLITIGTFPLSEHNRAPVSISIDRIQKVQRMSNGTLRKFFINDKKSISISWTMLPSRSSYTVDAGYGARDIKDFYEGATGKGSFPVTVKYGTTDNAENLTMIFTACNFELVRRNAKILPTDTPQELWNVSITMEEV
ncbi:MAG: hypothetical protein ACO3UU_02260 [Minisyncoccia bacterium]